jgi:hypothetical protein
MVEPLDIDWLADRFRGVAGGARFQFSRSAAFVPHWCGR